MNVITEPDFQSDINYKLQQRVDLIDVLRKVYQPEYLAILDALKDEDPGLKTRADVEHLFSYDEMTLRQFTDALCASAKRLGLELSSDEAERIIFRSYYVLVDFLREFGFENLLEGILAGYKIAAHIRQAIAGNNYKIHDKYEPEGIIEIDGWIYGICIRRNRFRSLYGLRTPGVDSTFYRFDGLNEDFYFTQLLSDEDEEKLLKILDGYDND